MHCNFKNFNYQLCFYGEHLLAEHHDKPVAIVESEKTAIIASALMPNFVWLATGGKSGCKWKEYDVHKVLKEKNVLLFPDFGYANRKTGKTCYQYWCECAEVIRKSVPCRISVSRILEDTLPEAERINDLDLVDVFIRRERRSGYAVDNKGKFLFITLEG
ncbi:hypothetical protein SAE01_40280 [Segetibacter aerophilus]|uniref:DUF6371 domain-containing protein n=1 Tax=Segetibacter aerophilus TaxID=670293 RepID=A0A512BHU2_9BACT|nr:hypothetical protein SAE01_40280 [Segetibacter aerophilus]